MVPLLTLLSRVERGAQRSEGGPQEGGNGSPLEDEMAALEVQQKIPVRAKRVSDLEDWIRKSVVKFLGSPVIQVRQLAGIIIYLHVI